MNFKDLLLKEISSTTSNVSSELLPILQSINEAGGISYLVGGSVRDIILGRKLKDLDIEIHNLSLDKLEKLLGNFGPVRLVGKKFGVLIIDGFNVDWSLPRKDSIGRKPEVIIDKDMSIETACRRRDLTMNAMAINLNLLEDEKIKVIDPYGGLNDIENKKLSAVDENLFLEDPLRFFRVMQFVGRFEMQPDEDLNKICKSMSLIDFQTDKMIAKERIFEEIKKLFLKSRRPSLGFRWLLQIGRLKELFPELYDLVGCLQRVDYHPEGDAFEHTMQSLDAAAVLDDKYKSEETLYVNEREKLKIMFAVLCHDLGKSEVTDEDLHSYGHAKVSAKIAKTFLNRFVLDKELIRFASKLSYHHCDLGQLMRQNSSQRAYKRLALKLHPVSNIRQLALVTLADMRGRNPNGPEPLDVFEDEFNLMLQKVRELKIEDGIEKPVLVGRDLLDVVEPGPMLGEILKYAYQIQINEGVKEKEVLRKKAVQQFKLL